MSGIKNRNKEESLPITDAKERGDNPGTNTKGLIIKVLGGGCAKCSQLESAAEAALKRLTIDGTIEPVSDFVQIASFGVMSTPALVVNGKVVSGGRVLKTEEIVKILEDMKE